MGNLKSLYSIRTLNPRTLHSGWVRRRTIYCCIVTTHTVKAQEKNILPEVGFTNTSNGSTQAFRAAARPCAKYKNMSFICA